MAVLLTSFLMVVVKYNSFVFGMESDVKQTANAYQSLLNNTAITNEEFFASVPDKPFRITVISESGEVLFDNESDTTENHADRPEIVSARETGTGHSTRYSDTIQEQTFYYALLLDDGNVLRVSETTATVFRSITDSSPFIIISIFVVLIGSYFIAGLFTKRLIKPINEIDIESPVDNQTYDELSPLLLRIDTQNVQLRAQMADMQKMRDELSDIMEHMEEGLIVLNSKGSVLSINNAALSIIKREKDFCIGKFVLELHRGDVFQHLSEKISKKENVQTEFSENNKIYHVSVSNISSGGTILMFMDVTQRQNAEKLRREFSANVSHELKTPLQTISGCAELLKNNLVNEADIPQFIDKIYSESIRMTVLIQDIIKLSQLDENAIGMTREITDLSSITEQVLTELCEKIEKKNILVETDLQSAKIKAIPIIIKECIFNLVDNAIKYSNEASKITLSVKDKFDKVEVIVKDSGIGIPLEEQDRIFERFYRVEKSRNRDMGGTGLGLSIVKHAVAVHEGNITLSSEEGKGTKITIVFPKTK